MLNNQNKECGCGNHDEHMHEHHHEGCGCGHDHEHEHGPEVEVLRLILDDETEVECYVLGVYEVKEKNYIALLPVEDDRVLLYEYIETEEGPQLLNIEDDEVFEAVARAFEEAELADDEDGE